MLSHLQSKLAKRAMDYTVDVVNNPDAHNPVENLRAGGWLVILANLLLLFPIIILSSYTIQKVLPILAIVEDENPPAYEPVAIDDSEISSGSIPGVPQPAGVRKPASAAVPTRPLNLGDGTTPITKSVRATWRLWKSYGGFRSIFRGFACYIFQESVLGMVVGSSARKPIIGMVLSYVGTLILVQFSTAWVHIVMTPPSKLHFWQRLPPYKQTLAATWRPITLAWLATRGTGHIFTVLVPTTPDQDPSKVTWVVSLIPVFLLIRFLLSIPAYVILIRVQASLLPDDQETIIPFDRSFQGKVEPRIVGGPGYASIRDVWTTFSRAAWIRYIKFSVKIAIISTAVFIVMFIFMIPSFFVLSAVRKGDPQNGPQ